MGMATPSTPKYKLLNIALTYWNMLASANLKCRLFNPNIIFSSLRIWIYGRWYNPPSGLFVVASASIRFVTSPTIKISLIGNNYHKMRIILLNSK